MPPAVPSGRARYILPVLLSALIVLSGCAHFAPPALGLWAECQNSNRTIDDSTRLKTMILNAQAAGFEEIFLQVVRGGTAWYDSRLLTKHNGLPPGYDPLREAIAEAHKHGIKVHAWINCFNYAFNYKAEIFNRLGYDTLIRDNQGRPVTAYIEESHRAAWRASGTLPEEFTAAVTDTWIDTPGLWVDPGNPLVRQYVLQVIRELAERYPDLDGIHLDYVRYPYALPIKPLGRMPVGTDFGYSRESRDAFAKDSGKPAPFRGENLDSGTAFDSWRRDNISAFVREARTELRALNPRLCLSAAVLAWADRAYLSSFQDWRGWLEQDLVDLAVVMNYSRDPALARYISRQSVAARGRRNRVYIGLGAYLWGDEPEGLFTEMRDAEQVGADGLVLFSYDNLLIRPEILSLLQEKRRKPISNSDIMNGSE